MRRVMFILVFLIGIINLQAGDTMKKVTFKSEGLKVVGNLYYPKDFYAGKKYPAIIVSGSWTTVKEQMAGLYARRLAEQGLITLAFDFRNFGESEGEPRFFENPEMKIQDIKNAVTFLSGLDEVDKNKIGAFGVCAGAGYTLVAASEDPRIKAVATAASWLHDSEAVKLFYGGEEGVNAKIDAARSAKEKYSRSGEVEYIASISTTDSTAAMYGPYDYYLNPDRGAIPEWSAEKFAVMSWENWLTFDPMPSAKKLSSPVLMIHSDGCVLPDYTKKYYNDISSEQKKLHYIESGVQSPMEQFDFYDNDEKVNMAVKLSGKWYEENL